MAIVELTNDTFDKAVEENEMVVLDFWTETCEPCKSFAKVYEEVSNQHEDVLFAKINAATEPELAQDFEVRSVPLLMILRQGIALFSESGAMPSSTLNDLIEQAKAVDMDQLKSQIAAQQNSDS